MIVPMLLGCAAPEPAAVDTAADSGTDGTSSPAPPLLSADEALAVLDALYTTGLPDPGVVQASYLEALSHSDESCPGLELQMNTQPEGCTAESGYHYSGLATYLLTEEPPGWTLSAEMEITPPSGVVFGAGGAAGLWGGTTEKGWWRQGNIHGSWQSDDAPFLAAGFSGSLALFAESAGSDRYMVGMDGAISYGGAVVVDLSMVSARSSECFEYFLGLYQVRDEYGRWYELELSECTGCGEVRQDGMALGEGCMQTAGAPAALLATLALEE